MKELLAKDLFDQAHIVSNHDLTNICLAVAFSHQFAGHVDIATLVLQTDKKV